MEMYKNSMVQWGPVIVLLCVKFWSVTLVCNVYIFSNYLRGQLTVETPRVFRYLCKLRGSDLQSCPPASYHN